MQSDTFRRKCIIRCVIITASFLLTLLIIFLGVPLAIKKSEKLQRYFVFPTHNLLPEDPEFSNFQKYNIYGGRNLQINVSNDSAFHLGIWHLLPHALADEYLLFKQFDYDYALKYSRFPVVVYFHANGGNRIKFANMYHVLRKFFHIIAFDYRGYGDSSGEGVIPGEMVIVEDCAFLYKWLRERTDSDIYFWGHSIGAALSSHTVVKLQEENLYVNGLVLEAPFTTIKDQLTFNSFYKFFSWLPWYETTMLNSLQEHGFVLNTTKHITEVDCCIMIIHAKDDRNNPYKFSETLYEIGIRYNRSITLHLLPEQLRCGHYSIRKAPELSDYIKNHIRTCHNYNKKRKIRQD